MAAPQPPLQSAEVLWWNKSDVYVRCPFCDEIHHHTFTSYPGSERAMSRVSDCGGPRRGSYKMVFPFDEVESQAWYSIDKTRALFVKGGELPSDYFRGFESEDDPKCNEIQLHARQALHTKRRWHEAMETIAVDLKTHDIALIHLLRGSYIAVQHHLDSSEEADLFLHGIEEYVYEIPPDDNYGDEEDLVEENEASHDKTVRRDVYTTGLTTLHLAAGEEHPNLVRLLLERGADANARDVNGRTPLMESCLWGRLDNVRILLQYGADKNIPSVRDGQRYLPVEFACRTKENIEERHRRSRGHHKEDTYERDKDRKIIVDLLGNPTQGRLHDDGNRRRLWGSAFTKPHGATMVTFTAHFDIRNQYKTVGVLYRGAMFHTIAAMSGWGHSEWETDSLQVAGKAWTSEVHSLCERIDFRLEKHSRDRGIPGNYNACHAEKQLIAYFVDQHSLDGSQHDAEEKLVKIVPPVSVRSAEIMVSRPICDDCNRFVYRVNEVLGLDISIVASFR